MVLWLGLLIFIPAIPHQWAIPNPALPLYHSLSSSTTRKYIYHILLIETCPAIVITVALYYLVCDRFNVVLGRVECVWVSVCVCGWWGWL